MAEVLNRMGFRLRKVGKAKPQEDQRDRRHLDNIKKRRASRVIRPRQTLELDCKRRLDREYSRGGLTRAPIKQ